MRSRFSSTSLVSGRRLFHLEQWAALLIGVLCLGVSLWVALHGHGAFSISHRSRFAEEARDALGWSLTIANTFFGFALLRFAFYQPGEKKAGIEPLSTPMLAPEGGASQDSRTANLVSRDGGRG